MRSDELRAQVLARPDDDAPLKVWADALLAEGNPRGEFIVLQLEHEAGRLDAAGQKRMETLQEQHGRAWLTGQVARLADRAVFRRGRPVEVWLGQKTEPQLLSADWSGVRCIGFADAEQLMSEAPELVDALLKLSLTGVKGVTASLVSLLPVQLEELSIHAAALDETVLDQLSRKLTRLRALHVQGAQRPVLGHLVCASRLAGGVEQLAIDYNTFELLWRPRDSFVRVHVFAEEPPLLRIEAELRAGPAAKVVEVQPSTLRAALLELTAALRA
jgi:uncharacterized protein (TIGR02996 family)